MRARMRGVRRQRALERFDRHAALQARVEGDDDRAESTLAEHSFHPIAIQNSVVSASGAWAISAPLSGAPCRRPLRACGDLATTVIVAPRRRCGATAQQTGDPSNCSRYWCRGVSRVPRITRYHDRVCGCVLSIATPRSTPLRRCPAAPPILTGHYHPCSRSGRSSHTLHMGDHARCVPAVLPLLILAGRADAASTICHRLRSVALCPSSIECDSRGTEDRRRNDYPAARRSCQPDVPLLCPGGGDPSRAPCQCPAPRSTAPVSPRWRQRSPY